jgi:4-hydroxybenzoate polyprenyltransferase
LVAHPLVVDLDGTLIQTDMLHESALKILKEAPLATFCIPAWLRQGKAVLKANLAQRSDFNPATLPYNTEFLSWLDAQKKLGRRLVLCTASDFSIATAIATHLNIFDEVLASDGLTNLAGAHKAQALVQRFGAGGFDYAGNSEADLAVWQVARRAIVVNGSAGLEKKTAGQTEIEQVFPAKSADVMTWRKVFRVHQWMKNLLLFVPMLAAHQLANIDNWLTLILAFFSFSLCASSVYIVNDLLDLESDRLHPRKRLRPFAAGSVPIWMGVALAPLLLGLSLILGYLVGTHFLAWLMFYFALTASYSWVLKRLMLLDCLTLAVLYTLRVIAGAAAVNLSLSFWLLGFSVFLFLSLAFVKRYAELEVQVLQGKRKVHGRGYYTTDAPLIQTMGITAGYAAVLVLALYLNSDAVLQLYRTPHAIWAAIPVLLFWISWIWMQAHRGNMHDDPLVFAVKDKASLAAGLVFAVVLFIGAVGWPW